MHYSFVFLLFLSLLPFIEISNLWLLLLFVQQKSPAAAVAGQEEGKCHSSAVSLVRFSFLHQSLHLFPAQSAAKSTSFLAGYNFLFSHLFFCLQIDSKQRRNRSVQNWLCTVVVFLLLIMSAKVLLFLLLCPLKEYKSIFPLSAVPNLPSVQMEKRRTVL